MRLDHSSDNPIAHCAIHDRSQFEVQFNYDVAPEHMSQGKAHDRYRVEAYFFFPSNMGVTALSFPREEFYRSLYAYIRFRTPEISELTLLDPLSRQSPLNALSFGLKQIGLGRDTSQDGLINEARLFGCVVSGLMRARAKELEARMRGAKRHGTDTARWRGLEGSLLEFLDELPELLGRYRTIVDEFRSFEGRLEPTTLDRLKQVDEFLTYRFDHTMAELHFQLQSTWESPTRLARVADRLHDVAERESNHRDRQGYITLAPGDDNAMALYTYRSGALKKIMDQVLYLDVKTISQTTRWKNIAAGLGALFAAYSTALANTGSNALQSEHIYLAVTVFALAYMVRDRVKEVAREKVWARISKYFPDNKLLIHDPTKDIDVGRCHERVVYMTKSKVPADVLKVRNTQHVIDLDSERKETVIMYQNDLKLNAKEILSEHQRRTDIKHILRFSVEELLGRLDNPTARVQFYDPESRIFCRLRAPKVYHLNLVFRLTHWDERDRKEVPSFHRIRVVLDKNGIQRIDTVAGTGTGETRSKAHGAMPSNTEPLGEENLF